MAAVYLQNRTEIRPVVQYILTSPWFTDPSVQYARYSWPPEFVARAIKEVGWQGLSLDELRNPLANMGQLLFEPFCPIGVQIADLNDSQAPTDFVRAQSDDHDLGPVRLDESPRGGDQLRNGQS